MISTSPMCTNHRKLHLSHLLLTNNLQSIPATATAYPGAIDRTTKDGLSLYDWSNNTDLKLLYNHKLQKTYYSAVWKTFTNPDLTFYTHEPYSSMPQPVHTIGDNFLRSQHQPTIIQHPAMMEFTPTTPIPRWNLNKVDWAKFKHLFHDL